MSTARETAASRKQVRYGIRLQAWCPSLDCKRPSIKLARGWPQQVVLLEPVSLQPRGTKCRVNCGGSRLTRRGRGCQPPLASDEKKILRSPAPSTDGCRPDQSWSLALGSVAHVQRITVGKVRGDIAVIGDRDIGAFFSQLNAVAVVLESMGKQTSSAIFAPGHCSNQHGSPPKT